MIVDIDIKNPKYNPDGVTIDVEINHPKYGWIPFTASPMDPEEHGRVIHKALIEGQFGAISPFGN